MNFGKPFSAVLLRRHFIALSWRWYVGGQPIPIKKYGVARSLGIGDAELRYAVFLVFPDDTLYFRGRKEGESGIIGLPAIPALETRTRTCWHSTRRATDEPAGVRRDCTHDAAILSELRFDVGGFETVLKPAEVTLMENIGSNLHGNFGFDLMSQAQSVTIDFRTMRLTMK